VKAELPLGGAKGAKRAAPAVVPRIAPLDKQSANAADAATALAAEVRGRLVGGAKTAKLPQVKGNGSVQQRFHCGNDLAKEIHRRAQARLSMAGLTSRIGQGAARVFSAGDRGLAPRSAPPRPAAHVVIARQDAMQSESGANIAKELKALASRAHAGDLQCELLRLAERFQAADSDATMRSQKQDTFRRRWRTSCLKRRLSGGANAVASGRSSISAHGSQRQCMTTVEESLSASNAHKKSATVKDLRVQLKSSPCWFDGINQAKSRRCSVRGVGDQFQSRWLLGCEELPGWSARLVRLLGDSADVAQHLACSHRQGMELLLADVGQMAAEFLPSLRKAKLEIECDANEHEVLGSAYCLCNLAASLAMPIEGSTAWLRVFGVGASAAGVAARLALAAELEGIRVRRVDHRLKMLRRRADSLSGKICMEY